MSGIYRGPNGSATADALNIDGDKGDLTISNSGLEWTINPDVVTTTKLGGDITPAGKALLDDADASAQRTTLGLGDASTANIGADVLAYDSNLQSFVDTFTLPTTDATNGFVLTTDGAGTLSLTAPGGIADNAYGDITVSSGATVWTVNNDAITYTKIQNVSATDKLLGRSSAGAGNIEEITCTSAGRNLLDDVDASAQRTTLGLGNLAVLNTIGTSQIDNLAIIPSKLSQGSPTWNSTGNTVILGTTTNDNVGEGIVGQYKESIILLANAISLANNVAINVTSLSLTAGDWDVSAIGRIHSNGASTSFTQGVVSISTTSDTLDIVNQANITSGGVTPAAGINYCALCVPSVRISIAATTTVYLVVRATFSGGTAQAYGRISARRVR